MDNEKKRLREKYFKVQVMTERGTPGEKENAKKILGEMVAKHSWLSRVNYSGEEYDAFLKKFVREWNQRQRRKLRSADI